jgi:ankyrin repeat protein
VQGLLRAVVLGSSIVQLTAAGAVAQDSTGVASLSPQRVKELYFDAAREGRVDLLAGLMKEGMGVDLRDPRGFTPLILAAFLIGHGADPCAIDPKGNSSLMGVAFRGETEMAVRLLAERCDINAANRTGQTALMMAAMFGRTEVVKLLVGHGADPALKDLSGNTAAGLARQQGNGAMAALIDGK